MPLSFIFCLRLANENSNFFASWKKTYVSIFLRKMLCKMELNAFARSRKIATVSLLWSKLDEIVSTSSKTASVAAFSWNPHGSLFKILCLSMKSVIWVRRRSKIFAKLRLFLYNIWILSCALPQFVMLPQLRSTCHYRINHYVKISHVQWVCK